jgi:hypothetical protein
MASHFAGPEQVFTSSGEFLGHDAKSGDLVHVPESCITFCQQI